MIIIAVTGEKFMEGKYLFSEILLYTYRFSDNSKYVNNARKKFSQKVASFSSQKKNHHYKKTKKKQQRIL